MLKGWVYELLVAFAAQLTLIRIGDVENLPAWEVVWSCTKLSMQASASGLFSEQQPPLPSHPSKSSITVILITPLPPQPLFYIIHNAEEVCATDSMCFGSFNGTG